METHFKKEDGLDGWYFGYRWEGNNMRNAARGARGVGLLISNEIKAEKI